MKDTSLTSLPSELWAIVFSYLDLHSTIRTEIVCRAWAAVHRATRNLIWYSKVHALTERGHVLRTPKGLTYKDITHQHFKWTVPSPAFTQRTCVNEEHGYRGTIEVPSRSLRPPNNQGNYEGAISTKEAFELSAEGKEEAVLLHGHHQRRRTLNDAFGMVFTGPRATEKAWNVAALQYSISSHFWRPIPNDIELWSSSEMSLLAPSTNSTFFMVVEHPRNATDMEVRDCKTWAVVHHFWDAAHKWRGAIRRHLLVRIRAEDCKTSVVDLYSDSIIWNFDGTVGLEVIGFGLGPSTFCVCHQELEPPDEDDWFAEDVYTRIYELDGGDEVSELGELGGTSVNYTTTTILIGSSHYIYVISLVTYEKVAVYNLNAPILHVQRSAYASLSSIDQHLYGTVTVSSHRTSPTGTFHCVEYTEHVNPFNPVGTVTHVFDTETNATTVFQQHLNCKEDNPYLIVKMGGRFRLYQIIVD